MGRGKRLKKGGAGTVRGAIWCSRVPGGPKEIRGGKRSERGGLKKDPTNKSFPRLKKGN